jgi:hypothetical protein
MVSSASKFRTLEFNYVFCEETSKMLIGYKMNRSDYFPSGGPPEVTSEHQDQRSFDIGQPQGDHEQVPKTLIKRSEFLVLRYNY